jgi:hypothetical protein
MRVLRRSVVHRIVVMAILLGVEIRVERNRAMSSRL